MPKVTVGKIESDYSRAKQKDVKWIKQAKEDLEFVLGEQWKAEEKRQVEGEGRPALTINIIKPILTLACGYQRANRSTIRAYPEGGEDQLSSEVASRLIKQILTRSRAYTKISQQFEEGVQVGKAFIEPTIDYTGNLLTGDLRLVNSDPTKIFIDPNSVEYDLSDAKYVIKETICTADDLQELFPNLTITKINTLKGWDGYNVAEMSDEETLLEKGEDYPDVGGMEDIASAVEGYVEAEKKYRLLEYYYKKYITQYIAVDSTTQLAKVFKTKAEAVKFLIAVQQRVIMQQAEIARQQGVVRDISVDFNKVKEVDYETQKIIKRKISQIWLASDVGGEIIEDVISPSWPGWKSYPFISYFSYYSGLAKKLLKRNDLAYQGMVRGLKDMQREKNKRRSQGLHIINVTANAGWLSEEGAWVNKEHVRQFGSKSGVNLEYKKGAARPERLYPSAIPHAHILFEEKSEEDIKMSSGVNPDMLAVQDKTTSGRAIALRQQQGILMLRSVFDNFGWTMELLGRYILSQLSELYTVDSAMRTLGADFIHKNFGDESQPGLPEEVIIGKAREFIGNLLNDEELSKFDITIGEGLESPTVRYSQYLEMLELVEKGIFIPPEVLLEYSDFPEAAKKQIETYIRETRQRAETPAAVKT